MKFISLKLLIVFCLIPLFVSCTNTSKVELTGNIEKTLYEKFDSKNASYIIENEEITLVNGIEKKEIVPDSYSMQITKHHGYEARYDINNDNCEDVFLFLTQSSDGSGTFYYFTGVLSFNNTYNTDNTFFIGDRILPVEILINNNVIEVVYLDRKEEEGMGFAPTIRKIKRFILHNKEIKEFEFIK